jgi:predicted phage tail protein
MQHNELSTVRLYGQLGTLFGRVHRLAVDSPREAIKALSTVIPGFEQYLMTAKQRGLTFAVFKGKKNIRLDEFDHNSGDREIRIAPIIIGSKQAGIFQTMLGAVMMIVGAIGAFTPIGLALGGAAWGTYAMQMGAAMALGGVIQMLSPQVGGLAMREGPDNKPSYAFGGPVNSIAQGNPVPVLYGRRRIGGAMISAGIYAEEQQ